MLKFAVIGASGLVGKKIVEILGEHGLLEDARLKLYVSGTKSKKTISIFGKRYQLVPLDGEALKCKFDIVFFSAGDEVSAKWAKKFVECGAFVVDNSNAFRRMNDVPLVVPEINSHLILSRTKLISNPNCSTIELAVVIDKLCQIQKISEIVVSTYQSVSGAGSEFLTKFLSGNVSGSGKLSNGADAEINGNIIPKIGEILDSGFSVEEDKIMFELNKILDKNIKICATAVRVPIPYCHGESVFVRFSQPVKKSEIEAALNFPHLVYEGDKISYPAVVTNTDRTHICRLRQAEKDSFAFFVLADNLRRGAAYNAVMIAKQIVEKFL